MATELYIGETVRITAQDLSDADGLTVTTGAIVTVALYSSADALISSNTASNDGAGDDWFYDLAAPATAGIYTVKVTVTAGESIAKAKEQLTVKAF